MTGHMGVPRTVPPVPCATVGLDGHMGQAMYDESLGQSLQSHVRQWDGTDTWDKLCMMGHMGVPRTVPSCPMWDNGTGRTLGTSYV